jgi:hypothetical protein
VIIALTLCIFFLGWWTIIVVLVGAIAILILAVNAKVGRKEKLPERPVESPAMLKTLVENRNRIISESLGIMSLTNELETLESRYWEALDSVNWIKEQVANGAPVKFNEEPEGFEYSLNRMFNEQLVRMASYHFDRYLKTIGALKTESAKERHKDKIRGVFDDYMSHLKSHENQNELRKIIENTLIP